MRSIFRFTSGAVLSALFLTGSHAAAQEVVVTEMVPYAIQDENGVWRGPAVDLFRAAADAAQVQYRLVPNTGSSTLPAAGAAFPAFADSQGLDGGARSLPFHVDTVGLIGGSSQPSFIQSLLSLFNFGFFKVLAIVCALLLVAGTVFWLVERRGNDDLPSGSQPIKGLGDGFWWAGVTATTIGYGDLVPRTPAGRTVAMIWMLFSMALTSILTAYLVSLTGQQGGSGSLEEAISGKRVGFIMGGPVSEADLDAAQTSIGFPGLPAALAALDAERIDLVAFPYQPAKSAAESRSVQRTSGSVVMPLFHVSGSERLRAELDRIILSPEWQQRMDDQFSD
ncbi:ion channel [Altericroceibacterium xinjiangense]|uniref:ion channel n=1 Tax=Altericroceibacterium xinjiangense TaxID=762261 RepID=UPI0013DF20FC|nr:ion channel [Altericroceibacterium xinjiangense]